MKSKKDILEIMEKFLNGEYDAMDLSYDLPELLIEISDEEWNNLPRKFVEEIPSVCSNYDPPLKYEGYLDEDDFYKEIKKYYEMIK